MTHKIIVTKPGFNATDPTVQNYNKVFSSEFVSPKIFKSVYFEAIGDWTHGLGYPPLFFISCRLPEDLSLEFTPGVDVDPFDGVDGGAWFSLTNTLLQSTTLCDVTVDERKVYCEGMGLSDLVVVHLSKDPLNA